MKTKTYYHVRIYNLYSTISNYNFENRLSILKFFNNYYTDLNSHYELYDLRIAFDVDFFRGVPHLSLDKKFFSHIIKYGHISRCQILSSGEVFDTIFVSCTKSVKRCK